MDNFHSKKWQGGKMTSKKKKGGKGRKQEEIKQRKADKERK